MKRFLLFVGLMILLGIVPSCDKDDYETTEDLPEWLQKKIPEIISPDSQLCAMTDVTVIRYNGKTYFNIYCGIWSCMFCHFYDEKGNLPDWDDKTWSDFHAHHEVVNTLPACAKK